MNRRQRRAAAALDRRGIPSAAPVVGGAVQIDVDVLRNRVALTLANADKSIMAVLSPDEAKTLSAHLVSASLDCSHCEECGDTLPPDDAEAILKEGGL